MSSQSYTPLPQFTHAQDCDILIVGAGIAGLSLAYHLSVLGLKPLVLEASEIASAATGKSAGIIAPQPVRNDLSSLCKRLGREAGQRLYRLILESGSYTFALIRELGIDCHAARTGLLVPGRGSRALKQLQAAVQDAQAIRNTVTMIDAAETARLSGVDRYSGALLDADGGGIDPVAYAQGLAAAAQRQGVQIYGNSGVTALARQGDGRWRATVGNTHAIARRVILCANGGSAALHPALSDSVLPLPVCEVETAPLAPGTRSIVLPEGHVLTDIETDIFSIRLSPANGIITAYPMSRAMPEMATIEAAVNRRLAAMIPAWTPLPLAKAWHGVAWLSTTLLPRLAAVDDGIFAVQACNGRGLALNTILGRDIAGWIADPARSPPPLPLQRPAPIRGYALTKYAPQLLMAAGLLNKRVRRIFTR